MLRDNLTGLIDPMFSSAGAYPLALCTDRNKSSDDRPQHALKIPARQGGIYALTENVTSPFHAEPRQNELDDPALPKLISCSSGSPPLHRRKLGDRNDPSSFQTSPQFSTS